MKKMKVNLNEFEWTREPLNFKVCNDEIYIDSRSYTDLWQRTYYNFTNDNAPVYQMTTNEEYFSFVVKTEFETNHRFDQCGIVMYLDSDNWLKASIEYENEKIQYLGSVVTNNGYSDWATTEVSSDIKSIWYRFSRRKQDFRIDCSNDGEHFKQMRVCHMDKAKEQIKFGIYACSPEDSTFTAKFSNMELMPCQWLAHDGQQPGTDLK